MDSGNSGSMQSSSSGTGTCGGDNDQEYESRHDDSISAFFNPTTYPSGTLPAFENGPTLLQLYSLKFNNGSSTSSSPPISLNQYQHLSNCFGSLESPNSLMAMNNNNRSSNNNSNNNCGDMLWPNKFGPIRSQSEEEANLQLAPVGGRSNNNNHHLLGAPGAQVLQHRAPAGSVSVPPGGGPSGDQNHGSGSGSGSGSGAGSGGRNPKKRSRASRKAPTTVLTTDTTNFRQMVQEFTGIRAPPFSASNFPSQKRLDMFGFGGMGMGMSTLPRTCLTISSSSPPLRSFPQKTLSSAPSTSTTVTNIISPSCSTPDLSTAISATNFQLPGNCLTFQSLLQASSSPTMNHLGSSHGTTTTTAVATNLGSDNGVWFRSERATDPSSWTAGPHQGLGLGRLGDPIRCLVNDGAGIYTTRINAINTSESDGGTIRAEGMLDSWICSSD